MGFKVEHVRKCRGFLRGGFTINRLNVKSLAILTIMLLFVVLAAANALAGTAQLTMTVSKTELQPQEQLKVVVQALDENKQPVTTDATVFVRITRGGLLPQKLLKEGLVLKNGTGEFTYIAPTKTGPADILLIEPATNASAKLTLNIVEEKVKVNWKKEFAQIGSVKGNVAYKLAKENNWRSSVSGVQLHEGDSIRTWDKSWATLTLFDGTEITLEPYTTLYIKFLQSSIDNAEVKQSVFKVFTGKVLCKAKKYVEKGSRFAIETESTVAGIRGTIFEYADTIEGDNELIVYDGAVMLEYIPEDLHFLVEKGHKIAIPSGEFNVPDVVENNVSAEDRDKAIQDEQAAADAEKAKEQAPAEENKDATTDPNNDPSKAQSDKTGQLPPSGDTNTDIGNTHQGPEVETPDPKGNNGDGKKTDGLGGFLNNLTPDQAKMLFGSERSGDRMFMTLSLQPEFKRFLGTPLSFGLNLTIAQDFETGKVTFGTGDPSTKLNNLFNWIEYDGKYLYARYGNTEDITYGYGLLMGQYYKEEAKSIQLGLNRLTAAKLGVRVLLPLDIKSIYPWKTESTSSLYAGRLTSDFSLLRIPFRTGLNYVVDTNPELKELGQNILVEGPETYPVPVSGMSADLGMPLGALIEPYAEIAHLNNFGSGGEVGIRGKILSLLWYQAGLRTATQGFVPNYFGQEYEQYKKNSLDELNGIAFQGRLLPNLNDSNVYPATSGMYVQAGAGFSLAKLSIGYENYTNMAQYAPVLTSDLVATTPKLGNLPVISCGYGYKQMQFGHNTPGSNTLFNKNTMFSWFVNLPIGKVLTATYTSSFIPSDTEIKFTNEIGVSMPF